MQLELRVHPSYFVGQDELTAWALYRAMRGGDFSSGPLPFSGGYAEQPSCVMRAFDILAEAELRLTAKPKGEG